MSESEAKPYESLRDPEIEQAADVALRQLKKVTGDFKEPGQTAISHPDGSVTRYVSLGDGNADRQEFAKDGAIVDVIPISKQQSEGTDY